VTAAFEIIQPTVPALPVVAHVPHSSTVIPGDVRSELLIDDAELEQELIRLTDWHTEDLFDWLPGHGATTFVNRLSRFVFDPERFLDLELEATESVGQGVVYTHGTQRQSIRDPDPDLRAARIEALYRPYHAALEDLATAKLEEFGRCTLIDCHSFPSKPLPSELEQRPDRPDICIGTDPVHTPAEMAAALERALIEEGLNVTRDMPYSGTFVPSRYIRGDARVHSVMIEVNRALYLDERTAERSPNYRVVKAALERAVVRAGLLAPGRQ
jgi:N-formylglutamate amidohydrolase